MGGMYQPPSCAHSYCLQLCAYLAKAARSVVQVIVLCNACKNWKWVKCKLVESPNNVLIPLNLLIVKVAILSIFVTAQQNGISNMWLCITLRPNTNLDNRMGIETGPDLMWHSEPDPVWTLHKVSPSSKRYELKRQNNLEELLSSKINQ